MGCRSGASRAGADMRSASKRIVVGRIAGVFGVKGWLKVVSYTSPRENILNYTPWQLQLKDTWREVRLQDWKAHHKGLTVVLEGIILYAHDVGFNEFLENKLTNSFSRHFDDIVLGSESTGGDRVRFLL